MPATFSDFTIRLHTPGRRAPTMKCRGCGGEVFRQMYQAFMPASVGLVYVACARPFCGRSYVVGLGVSNAGIFGN